MTTSIETVLMTGEFAPESFGGVLLSGNAFNFLGVPPVIGRTIQPSDIRPDGEVEPVVVLSFRLWQRLFEGSPTALGRTLQLNGRPHTIVGVMPPRFGWYGNTGFWLPLSMTRTDLPWTNPIVRLKPGVSSEVAEEQLRAVHLQLAQAKPAAFPKEGFTTSLRNYLDVTVASGEMQSSLQLLLGAVAFLLLIACANVANLQLARGTARAREMAVRMSIGAGRRRLLRQLLTESVLLSLVGGVLGVVFAFVAIRSIVGLMPEFYVPNESRVAINVPVLLFSLAISVLTGVLFGLVPALQTSKADVTDVLRAGRSTGSETTGGRTRNLLVIAEVALSVVLLVSAGLTVRTFFVLQNMDTGIKSEHLLVVGVPLPPAKYQTLEQRNRFAEDLIGRVRTLPGVESATFGLPFGGPQTPFTIAGQNADESKRITVNLAGEAHLQTFGIALRRGRMFDAAELRRGDRVAVINESAAKLWPAGTEPVGALLRLPVLQNPPPRTLADTQRPPEVTIIGVIADTRNAGLRSQPMPAVVMPYTIIAPLQRTLAIRTSGDPNLALNPVRAAAAGHGSRAAARPPDHDERDPWPGSRATAVHDGAIRGLRRARPRPRRGRHLQRAVVPRHATPARARRAHGAWRPAPPRARPDARDGRPPGRHRVRRWSGRERRVEPPVAQPAVRRSARGSTLLCRRGAGPRSRDACRLLPPCPPRRGCRSHHCSATGVNLGARSSELEE